MKWYASYDFLMLFFLKTCSKRFRSSESTKNEQNTKLDKWKPITYKPWWKKKGLSGCLTCCLNLFFFMCCSKKARDLQRVWKKHPRIWKTRSTPSTKSATIEENSPTMNCIKMDWMVLVFSKCFRNVFLPINNKYHFYSLGTLWPYAGCNDLIFHATFNVDTTSATTIMHLY